MHYSLFSRFCGAFLGAVAGEMLGMSFDRSRSPTPQLKQPDPQPSDTIQTSWSNLLVLTTQHLLTRQMLDVEDWQGQVRSQLERMPTLGNMGVSELAIATLPMALFFHEGEIKLRHKLQQASQSILTQPGSEVGAWVMGSAIAQALQEKLRPLILIEQLLPQLRAVAPDSAIAATLEQQLQQVQTLLIQEAGLAQVQMQLIRSGARGTSSDAYQSTLPVALALYCVLSTSAESRVAMLRSLRLGHKPAVVGALTGALAGALNGRVSLPIDWCLTAESAIRDSRWLRNPQSDAGLVTLATDLLSIWSGTYDTHKFIPQSRQVPAIAAPRVIRPR